MLMVELIRIFWKWNCFWSNDDKFIEIMLKLQAITKELFASIFILMNQNTFTDPQRRLQQAITTTMKLHINNIENMWNKLIQYMGYASKKLLCMMLPGILIWFLKQCHPFCSFWSFKDVILSNINSRRLYYYYNLYWAIFQNLLSTKKVLV